MHFFRTLTQSSVDSSESQSRSIVDSAYASVESLSILSQPKIKSIISKSHQYGVRIFSDDERDEILRQSLIAGEVRKEERKQSKKFEKMRLKERLEILEEEQKMEVSLSSKGLGSAMLTRFFRSTRCLGNQR